MCKFQETALSIPKEYRCVQTSSGRWSLPLNDCFFGVPQSNFFGWTVLNTIPKELKGVHFYLGGEHEGLILDFSLSKHPQFLERLSIGNSSYAVGSHQDYRNLIKNIINTAFPKLKHLELGVWELFCNSHCLYGKLGDITSLLINCPQLNTLGLYGCFELNQQLNFSSLKKLKSL